MLRCKSAFFVLVQYLGSYALALIILISPLAIENRLNINEVLVKRDKRKVIIYLMGFFRLGGSPPFLGFYAKIIVAQILLVQGYAGFLLYLVSSSVFLLYVYMRFFYQAITSARPQVEAVSSKYFYERALILIVILLVVFP